MALLQELLNKRVFPADLERYCTGAMERAGLPRDAAAVSARVLATTDSWGIHTHGTRQIRQLMKNVRDGRIAAAMRASAVAEGPVFAILDGNHAMPIVTACTAMELAIRKAREAGIAY